MTAEPTATTWTSLLAHWTMIAQASVALPAGREGDRWRSAVPAIIGLQAVTHALADLDRKLEGSERLVGQDKAELLIREHAGVLHGLWRSEPLPGEVAVMIQDARSALEATRASGCEWSLPRAAPGRAADGGERTFDHPGELAEQVAAMGFAGDLFLPAPGVVLMPTSPIGFARALGGGPPQSEVVRAVSNFLELDRAPVRSPCFRQIYRQFDFGTGRIRRDLVVPERSELAAGQPLLVPVVLGGRVREVPLPPPPGAVDRVSEVPVEFAE